MTALIRRSGTPSWRLLASCICAAVLSAGPTLAGPPFRTDDPEPVDFQHFEINLVSLGTRTTSDWSGILPGLEVNYGALPNLQLHAIVPQGDTAPDGGRTGFALGDIELGAKYRFITPAEDDWFPQVGVFPLVEVPVGNQKLGLGTGHAQLLSGGAVDVLKRHRLRTVRNNPRPVQRMAGHEPKLAAPLADRVPPSPASRPVRREPRLGWPR